MRAYIRSRVALGAFVPLLVTCGSQSRESSSDSGTGADSNPMPMTSSESGAGDGASGTGTVGTDSGSGGTDAGSSDADAGSGATDAGLDALASQDLVPASGALWGFYATGPNYSQDLEAVETSVGRQFDIAKRYHDFSNLGENGAFPTSDELSLLQGGRILHLAWESRVYGTTYDTSVLPSPAGDGGTGDVYTYAQITSGALDRYIDAVAARLRALPSRVFVDFNHEADDATDLGGSNTDRTAAGSSAGFQAAFAYLVNRFRSDGVTQVVWVVVFSGYQADAIYTALYPGDAVVDWIGWDPYNHVATNWMDPLTTFNRFYNRIDGGLFGTAASAAKPRMLAEYGCIDDSRRPAWLEAIPAALEQLPRLLAVEYFDSSSGGTYALSDTPSLQAFTTAGHDPYVNPMVP
jgi:hypothetical protein